MMRLADLGPLRYAMMRNPWPTLIVSYHRQYFVSHDEQVRLTIDTSVSAFPQIFSPYPQLERRALTPGIVIIELKADDAVWQRVAEIMAPLPFRAMASSKYIAGALASF